MAKVKELLQNNHLRMLYDCLMHHSDPSGHIVTNITEKVVIFWCPHPCMDSTTPDKYRAVFYVDGYPHVEVLHRNQTHLCRSNCVKNKDVLPMILCTGWSLEITFIANNVTE